MTVANLGLAVDSRQAASAVVDLDKLAASAGRTEKAADSLAAGAKRADTATAQMSRTIRETVGSNDNATSAINRHVRAIQALTAAESRGGGSSYAQRAADIEAYGKSLDEMRARVNPAYAAIRQYREQVELARTAHRLGAVSADEMAAAISRERQATLASLAALRERQQAIAASTGASYSSNIAAQFQDIGVTSAMGMSPLQIALQQGSQLSAVFNDLKTQGLGVGAALTSAFASVVSPLSLVTIGAVAASAAMIQYFSSISSEGRSTADILSAHEAMIAKIKERYGEATGALKAYVEENDALQRRQAEISLGDLKSRLLTESQAILRELGLVVEQTATTTYDAIATGFDESLFVMSSKYEAFRQPIEDFRKSVEAGVPAVGALRVKLNEIAQTSADASIRALADGMLRATDEAGKLERGIPGATDAINQIGEAAAANASAIGSYGAALRALSEIAPPKLSVLDQIDAQLQRGLANAGGEPWREALLYQQAEDAKTRYFQQEAQKRAEQTDERIKREAKQEQDALARRIEGHQWALQSEREQEQSAFDARMEDLDKFYQGKVALEAEYRDLKERAEEDHAARVTEIMDRQAQRELAVKQQEFRVMGDMFGNLATVANAFGEKGFIAAKAFSIGQAVMNTSEAITAALASAPPPLNFAAAAAVAAAGAVQIAAIASAKPGSARTPSVSGGGGGYSAGAAGGPAVQKPNNDNALPNTAYLQITGKGTMTMDEVREIADKFVELQKDGYKLVVGS